MGVGGGSEIALQECAAHIAIPDVGPLLQKRNVFLSHRWLPERTVGGVLKRAHHPGDIAEGRAFQFPFAERTRRFAFEIEENKIATGVKGLTKMKVAMNANLMRGRPLLEEASLLRENLLLGREDFLSFSAKRFRQIVQFLSEQFESAPRGRTHRLDHAALRHGIKWLRCERGIVDFGGKRTMQSASPLTK